VPYLTTPHGMLMVVCYEAGKTINPLIR